MHILKRYNYIRVNETVLPSPSLLFIQNVAAITLHRGAISQPRKDSATVGLYKTGAPLPPIWRGYCGGREEEATLKPSKPELNRTPPSRRPGPGAAAGGRGGGRRRRWGSLRYGPHAGHVRL